MSAGHTPGPWTLRMSAKRSAFARIDAQDEDGTFMVAEIAGGEGSEYALGEGLANARLIAAAPAMLGALIDVLEPCPFSPDGIDALRAKVRSAIALATGT